MPLHPSHAHVCGDQLAVCTQTRTLLPANSDALVLTDAPAQHAECASSVNDAELARIQPFTDQLAAPDEAAEITVVSNHDDAHAPGQVDYHNELVACTQPFTEELVAAGSEVTIEVAAEVTVIVAENDCAHSPGQVEDHNELAECAHPFTKQLAAPVEAAKVTVVVVQNDCAHAPFEVNNHDELVHTEPPAASQTSDRAATTTHHCAPHTAAYVADKLARRQTYAEGNNLFSYDLSAMCATNLLKLVSCNPALVGSWAQRMILGVPRGARDDLDLAGKLPLCLKALKLGLDPSQLMIDCAQAGGVYGRSDGCIVKPDGVVQTIEMKGGICRQGRRSCFMIRNIRSAGVDWKHLFFTGRLRNPDRWDSLADMEGIMYLAYVRRDDYEQALAGAGKSRDEPVCASVSPHSRDSWLGRHLKWIRLSRLTREWWQQNVVA